MSLQDEEQARGRGKKWSAVQCSHTTFLTFVLFSVPFLATAIQEELETGASAAAASSDACSANSTVRQSFIFFSPLSTNLGTRYNSNSQTVNPAKVKTRSMFQS